jgi:hypothetical protein
MRNQFSNQEKTHLSYLGSMLHVDPSAEEQEQQKAIDAFDKAKAMGLALKKQNKPGIAPSPQIAPITPQIAPEETQTTGLSGADLMQMPRDQLVAHPQIQQMAAQSGVSPEDLVRYYQQNPEQLE